MVNDEYWRYGDISRLARAATPPLRCQFLHDIICGRRAITLAMAHRLSEAGGLIGKRITIEEWMERSPDHGAFRNKG